MRIRVREFVFALAFAFALIRAPIAHASSTEYIAKVVSVETFYCVALVQGGQVHLVSGNCIYGDLIPSDSYWGATSFPYATIRAVVEIKGVNYAFVFQGRPQQMCLSAHLKYCWGLMGHVLDHGPPIHNQQDKYAYFSTGTDVVFENLDWAMRNGRDVILRISDNFFVDDDIAPGDGNLPKHLDASNVRYIRTGAFYAAVHVMWRSASDELKTCLWNDGQCPSDVD